MIHVQILSSKSFPKVLTELIPIYFSYISMQSSKFKGQTILYLRVVFLSVSLVCKLGMPGTYYLGHYVSPMPSTLLCNLVTKTCLINWI